MLESRKKKKGWVQVLRYGSTPYLIGKEKETGRWAVCHNQPGNVLEYVNSSQEAVNYIQNHLLKR